MNTPEAPTPGPLTGVFTGLVAGAIRGYQLGISPFFGQRCRFYPSCSEYALQALRTHGLAAGSGLAAWRILRCNPWNHGGVDFVPGTEPAGWRPGDSSLL